jgi:lambda repressor-like predicted transcriptional regulator
MRLIDQVVIPRANGGGVIELLVGDLSMIPPEQKVDVLVVSAFPHDYSPAPGTLIAALDHRGVSLNTLSRDKEIDMRGVSNCWLSRRVSGAEFGFSRVLCFEPDYGWAAGAASVVGDVFRSLVPFAEGEPWVRSAAMPILAAGNQRQSPFEMLPAMLEASAHWLAAGLQLDSIKIVIYETAPQPYIDELAAVFTEFRSRLGGLISRNETNSQGYDVFVSYAHKDEAYARRLVDRLAELKPELRVFIDRLELDTGVVWQQCIYEALEASRRVLCLYSPDYLTSLACMEEYNIARLLHRERNGLLLPAYLRSTDLPAYMRLVQYLDVREGDPGKLENLAHTIISESRHPRSTAPPQRRTAEESTLAVASASRTASTGENELPADLTDALATLLRALTGGESEIHLDVTIRVRRP